MDVGKRSGWAWVDLGFVVRLRRKPFKSLFDSLVKLVTVGSVFLK